MSAFPPLLLRWKMLKDVLVLFISKSSFIETKAMHLNVDYCFLHSLQNKPRAFQPLRVLVFFCNSERCSCFQHHQVSKDTRLSLFELLFSRAIAMFEWHTLTPRARNAGP